LLAPITYIITGNNVKHAETSIINEEGKRLISHVVDYDENRLVTRSTHYTVKNIVYGQLNKSEQGWIKKEFNGEGREINTRHFSVDDKGTIIHEDDRDYHCLYLYDSAGNPIEKNCSGAFLKYVYQYNDSGKLILSGAIPLRGQGNVWMLQTKYSYNDQRHLIKAVSTLNSSDNTTFTTISMPNKTDQYGNWLEYTKTTTSTMDSDVIRFNFSAKLSYQAE
jgi:hypothetical protein